MTIAITIKVGDGVVLSADSAGTLLAPDGSILRVYNNANKIINLRKGTPVGFISWGSGGIGKLALPTLLKDLRVRLSGEDPDRPDWEIQRRTYTIEEVARRVREFIYEEHYLPEYGNAPVKPHLGGIIAGFSAGQPMADAYHISIDDGQCADPALIGPMDAPSVIWGGQPEALQRLILGFDKRLPALIETHLGVSAAKVTAALPKIMLELEPGLVEWTMPIQDAIELAEFLTHVAVNFSRFTPGAATVGGPIEVAAITKHEGFKWIRRKYYYQREINPEETHA